jgi:hypothetical protein
LGTTTFTGSTTSSCVLGFSGEIVQPLSKIRIAAEIDLKINTPSSYLYRKQILQ